MSKLNDMDDLSEGIPNMPRRFTARERFADAVRLYLIILSCIAFIIGGVIGYVASGVFAALAGLLIGYAAGVWTRRSLGLRGWDGFHCWFHRIAERADGSRAGLLEWVIESIRGHGFSIEQCQAITANYHMAMEAVKATRNDEEKESILKSLDQIVKRISYLGK